MAQPFVNIAGYRFVDLPDRDALREPFREACEKNRLLGTILLSTEGINFFLCGDQRGMDGFIEYLETDERFVDIPLKVSHSEKLAFRRMNVRLKKEIISMGVDEVKPGEFTGEAIAPSEFKQWLEEELGLPGIQNESAWINKVSYYIPSFAAYFHSAGYYKEEREALMVMHEFLGQRGVAWHLKMVDNLILDGKLEDARKKWETMKNKFPDFFATHLAEGLVFQSEERSWKRLL